jgi:hypothetical protein
MSAPEIIRGNAAFLVAAQGLRLHQAEGGEIYHLRTGGDCRIAVWDKGSRSLAVFDSAMLFALAHAAATEANQPIDPPSRL